MRGRPRLGRATPCSEEACPAVLHHAVPEGGAVVDRRARLRAVVLGHGAHEAAEASRSGSCNGENSPRSACNAASNGLSSAATVLGGCAVVTSVNFWLLAILSCCMLMGLGYAGLLVNREQTPQEKLAPAHHQRADAAHAHPSDRAVRVHPDAER